MNRIGKQTIVLPTKPSILSTAAICGTKEGQGRLASHFDEILTDDKYGENTWEQAESKMQRQAVRRALEKGGQKPCDIDLLFGGDLLNQCIGTTYGILDYNIPFVGLYGACSTMVEGLSLAALAVDGGYAKKAIAVTSSHFCSAERQYRFPLEYGGQRTPTAQWTVTGAGAALVGIGGNIRTTHVTFGKIVDFGIDDLNNMGSAMAPAAVSTILAHFADRRLDADAFDLIVTGDLGKIGHAIVTDQLVKSGLAVADKYIDCGAEIFDIEKQDVHAGGSGCGCCASVFCGWLYRRLQAGEINRLLLVATGALMSPTSAMQGGSIPGIAHAVAIEREG